MAARQLCSPLNFTSINSYITCKYFLPATRIVRVVIVIGFEFVVQITEKLSEFRLSGDVTRSVLVILAPF